MMFEDTSNGLETFFTAKSVAVIGASNHREKVGFQVLNNLVKGVKAAGASTKAHKRKIYPVNPTAGSILGQKCYPSITEITEAVELVIIVTPVGTVLSLIEEIVARNKSLAKAEQVKSVIIISAGFAETDNDGKLLQQRVLMKLSLANIRLLGPNTLGLIHTGNHLNASFAQQDIPAGNLAVISQSGAMLTALFNALVSRNAGVSFAVSLGNKADLNENDCLQYALEDQQTTAVIMYLESFSHLPQFFELVSKVRRSKPVIVLKGGTSSRGQVASTSHTAALATNQALLQAAAQQFGFTLVDNMEELMNVAFFLAHHRTLPNNTMVITNAGGPAVNTIDTLQNAGVNLARWSSRSQESLADLLPNMKANNPLDLLGDADPTRFKQAIEVAQRDQNIESLIIIITPQAVTDIPGIIDVIISSKGKKSIFVALMGGNQLEQYRRKLSENNIVTSKYANNLVDMLCVLSTANKGSLLPSRYALSEAHTPTDSIQRLSVKQSRRQLGKLMDVSDKLMSQPDISETFELLKKNGFTVPKYWFIQKENADQIEKLTYPLYVKTANLAILHKKQLGAVYGVAHDAKEGREAYEKMLPFGDEVLFQQVLDIDHELLVGIENDAQFGLYMTVGLGGSYTNLIADRAYCFLPAPSSILKKAWMRTKASQLFVKDPQLSESIFKELERLESMIMKHPWIRSIEINPLAIAQGQIIVADIKLQV